MTTPRVLTTATLVLSLALAAVGCGGKVPAARSPAACSDRCAAMTCPAGSSCTVDGQCNARCEQQPLSRP